MNVKELEDWLKLQDPEDKIMAAVTSEGQEGFDVVTEFSFDLKELPVVLYIEEE